MISEQPARVATDDWLNRWLPLIAERNALHSAGGNADILELGCGDGRDTATLIDAGHCVTGIDLSSASIARAQARARALTEARANRASLHCQDIREPFPLASCRVVVASLSLHYFSWPDTLALVERIRQTLTVEGILLCRLNSVNDHHYGASGHPEIEPDYYRVDGEAKRFFDEAAVNRMFSRGWRRLHLEETVIDRYEFPKSAWEVVVEKFAP